MNNYKISINQLAEFSKATEASQKRIIKQQISPGKFLIPWYQQAKGIIKRYLINVNDSTILVKGIQLLDAKKTESKRQIIDKSVSIEAIKLLSKIRFPNYFYNFSFEIIKPESKSYELNNVSILVAPDLIFKTTINNKTIYGAIKIHICKSKPFDSKQSTYVSTILYKYLKKHIASTNDYVYKDLCICLDVFGERVTTAPLKNNLELIEIKKLCENIKTMW